MTFSLVLDRFENRRRRLHHFSHAGAVAFRNIAAVVVGVSAFAPD